MSDKNKKKTKASVAAITGFPDYCVKGENIVHVPSGTIFGTKSGSCWQQPDDEGGVIIANSPEFLLTSLAEATADYNETHGFNEN